MIDFAAVRIRGRRVLCRDIKGAETLAAYPHIILSDADRHGITTNQAEILAVGPGDFDADGEWCATDPALVPGLWVLHELWARTPTWDDDLFLLLEDNVLAILEAE
jgi:co-chaperonin GroES (HSP10)